MHTKLGYLYKERNLCEFIFKQKNEISTKPFLHIPLLIFLHSIKHMNKWYIIAIDEI